MDSLDRELGQDREMIGERPPGAALHALRRGDLRVAEVNAVESKERKAARVRANVAGASIRERLSHAELGVEVPRSGAAPVVEVSRDKKRRAVIDGAANVVAKLGPLAVSFPLRKAEMNAQHVNELFLLGKIDLAMQNSPPLQLSVGHVMVAPVQKGKTAKDGVAVVVARENRVLSVGRMRPDVGGHFLELVLHSLGPEVCIGQREVACNFLQHHYVRRQMLDGLFEHGKAELVAQNRDALMNVVREEAKASGRHG